jgi:hypothetical protein
MAAALPEGNLQRQLPNLVRHSLVRGGCTDQLCRRRRSWMIHYSTSRPLRGRPWIRAAWWAWTESLNGE